MSDDNFPIIKRPCSTAEKPVIVSIPHYGTEPIPGVRSQDYADSAFVHLPWGFADTFAADAFGSAHEFGACVIATPYSRLFVDVNRRRDDFVCDDEIVTSNRGVIRTHTMKGKAIFSQSMGKSRAEQLLVQFYDPYHEGLQGLIEEMCERHGQILLLDMHTASPNRMEHHEVVVGTRRGTTAGRMLIDQVVGLFSDAGFEVHEDIPGYAGGHIVRRYGESNPTRVHAIQVEINSGLLMTTPRHELVPRMIRGEKPEINQDNVDRVRRCLETLVTCAAV